MYVVAIGPFENRELETLQIAAGECDLNLRAFDKPAEAAALILGSHEAPSGLFAARMRTITALSTWVRESPSLLNVPIVAMLDRATEGQFREAFAAGADDALLGADFGSLRQRLQTLSAHRPVQRPEAVRGIAMVTMPDGPLRRWVGRSLRQAGFELLFANDALEMRDVNLCVPTLIVTSRATVQRAAASERISGIFWDARIPKLVLADDAWEHAGDTKAKLLFFADDAAKSATATEFRRSERALYESICAFRAAGVMQPAYGLTHNISADGLFVRTLSAPALGDELWIELRTISGVPVHLRGRVMWRRDASRASATKPAGFGFHIDASQTPVLDLQDWQAAYESLKTVN